MFCLIYACLSNITPPVAISCYVAAGIADANQTKTGLIAVRLALTGFIVPIFFLANPALLLLAGNAAAATTIIAVITAAAGTVMLSGGLEGWFLIRQNWIERILFIFSALLLLYPGTVTDIAGFCSAVVLIAVQQFRSRSRSRNKEKNDVM